jgi:hypothetical protein
MVRRIEQVLRNRCLPAQQSLLLALEAAKPGPLDVRLPEGDVPAPMGSGLLKSAASRRFVALSRLTVLDFKITGL